MARLNKCLVLVMCAFLAACATNPMGWGGKYEIRLANSKAISIAYDPVVSGEGAIYKVASDHCAKFGKEPVPHDTVRRGLYPEATYYCE